MSCGSSFSSIGYSNLERFLYSVTPIVPSRTLSQSYIGDMNNIWQPHCKGKIKYFTLGDLWECYSEWSAYGVETPVHLSSGETISQYFVPSLSALQIYTSSRRNSDAESECWSDDSGSEKLSRTLSNNSSRGWDVISEDELENEHGNAKLGSLYLHYVETAFPHCRPPLSDKVSDLAHHYPGLMTLKSIDLGPASWMAVAWYPIYSIPCRKNEKNLSASFLTYHTLSSSFEDWETENSGANIEKDGTCDVASLSPFGLATYKMEGDFWLNQGNSDYSRQIDLNNAADSWLKQLNFQHNDFNFFSQHSVK